MLGAEKELAIQITQIDGVEVDYVDFAETGQDEVFEQLAADATSAHH